MVNGYQDSGPAIQATEWYLPFQNQSKLKILYTIPAFNFDGISPDTEDPSTFNQQETIPEGEFELELTELSIKLDKFSLLMSVYSKYQSALYNFDNGSFIVESTNKKFVIGGKKDETSLLSEIFGIESTINQILDDYGFVVIGSFTPQLAKGTRRRATSIKFGYEENYVLNKITIIERGCPDVVIEGEKLLTYSDQSPFNNPTIISYLSKINIMYDEIMGQEPPEWTEFLLKHTFPNLTLNYGENTIFNDQESLAECIAQGVADYGTKVVDRALDSVLSFTDVVSDKFNKAMCEPEDSENTTDATIAEIIRQQNYGSFIELALKMKEDAILKEHENFVTIIEDFYRRVYSISSKTTTKGKNGKKGVDLKKLYEFMFDDYQFCGMLALIKAIIECLSGGFSYEDMLKKVCEVALKQLTPLQISNLLVGLPPDKKVEVMNKVDTIIKQENLVQEFFNSFKYSLSGSASASNQAFLDQIAYEKQLEDNIVSAEVDIIVSDFYLETQQQTQSTQTSSEDVAEAINFDLLRLEEIDAEIKKLEKEIENWQSEINTNNEKIKEIENEIAAIESEVADVKTSLNGVEDVPTQYIELQNKVQNYLLQIEELQKNIEANQFLISINYTSIEELSNEYLQITIDSTPSRTTEEIEELTAQTEQDKVDAEFLLKQNTEELSNYRQSLGKNNLGEGLSKIQKVIVQAYIDALLELVDINELYLYISKFPGVKIINQFINAANCPSPPDPTKITWLNFLKTLEIEWCKSKFELTLPPLPPIPDIGAFMSTLWKVLGQVAKETIIDFITTLMMEIVNKLLSLLTSSFCELLNSVTQTAAAGLSGNLNRDYILDLIRQSFGCPPLDNAEQEEALLEAVAQIFGGQSGGSFTAQEVASALLTTSTSLTAFELVDLLKGNLSPDKASYLKKVLRANSPKFTSLFQNENAICGLFSTLGNLIPDDILNNFEDNAAQLINNSFPANTSVCGTPESIELFNNLREGILRDKGLSDDEIRQQIDNMNSRADESMTFLTDLASRGLNNVVADSLVSGLYGSDALDNPMAAVNQDPNCPTSIYGSPYSSAVVAEIQNFANSSLFDSLKTSYLNDLFKEPNIFEQLTTGMRPVAFLNAVLCDKNARDFVKHNKRTDDLFFRLYNSQEHYDDRKFPPVFQDKSKEKNFFPETISFALQDTLKKVSDYNLGTPNKFVNNSNVYTTNNGKRVLFGKYEDYSLIANGNTKNYNLLYSQFVMNRNVISTDNISRLAVITSYNEEPSEVLSIPDFEVQGVSTENSSPLQVSGSNLENFNIIYQSKFDLDDGITSLKQQYIPLALTNSPQADCFISFINNKISLGEYTSEIKIDVNSFNNSSTRVISFIISSLTDDEGYKFGYDYNAEKITQDDIELDPKTLSRKTDNPRVIFLDHTKYGGTQDQPAVYIKPPNRVGWLGVADSILPELSCDPKVEKIINFDELKSKLSKLQSEIKDDPKLMNDPDCREVVPYLKPLSGVMAASLQVAIATTMRIYISEAILRCIPLYNKFVVSYDKVIDELYIDYIVTKIENGLLNQGEGVLNVKNDKYYLYFLEQCVQVVSRLLVEESITLTDVEQQALDSINKMIQSFYFIKEKDYAFLKEKLLILNNLRELALSIKTSLSTFASLTEIDEKIFLAKYALFIATLRDEAVTYPKLSSILEKIESIGLQYFTNPFDYKLFGDLKKEIKNVLLEIAQVQKNYIGSLDPILSKVMEDFVARKDIFFIKNGQVNIPSLKRLRKEMVLEGIRQTKIEAKILMRKILKQELETMSAYFAANIYTRPSITNLRKYFLDDNNTLIVRPSTPKKGYFEVAANPANGDNPLNNNINLSRTPVFDLLANPEGFFILERYIKIQDRVLPISGTTIPNEIINRPENLYNVVNVDEFKNWISTLSQETKDVEMYKLFGNLSVTGSQQTGFELTGSTLGLQYGLRLSYVPPDSAIGQIQETFGNVVTTTNLSPTPNSVRDVVMLNKAYELSQAYVSGSSVPIRNSQFIIPIVNAEVDLINEKLGNFNPENGTNKYEHDCLVKALYETDEFRFLFYYCIPLQKYMSAIAAFISESYVKLIGINDGWESTPRAEFEEKEKKLNFYKSKEACQIFFDIFYNWEKTDYQNSKLKSMLQGQDEILKQLNLFLRPIGPNIYTDWRIVGQKPFDNEGRECDTSEDEED